MLTVLCWKKKRRQRWGTSFNFFIYILLELFRNNCDIQWKGKRLQLEKKNNWPTTKVIHLLALMVSSKYFLARRKDSLWIKLALSLDKSSPLISKMLLPFLCGFVMRKVQLEIKSIIYASLQDLLVLCHHLIYFRLFWMCMAKPKQSH